MFNARVAGKVWLFLITGVCITVGLLFLFTHKKGVFRPYYEISMRTGFIGELKPGASVLMSGISVGNVKSINLDPDLRTATVKMQILDIYKIKSNSKFTIEQRGFLGEQYVAIYQETGIAGYLKDGDIVESSEVIDFLQAARISHGMIARIKETGQKIEEISRRTSTMFNSNTVQKAEKIGDRFTEFIDSSSAIFKNITNLVECNRHYADAISSNIDKITVKWDNISTKYSSFTNELDKLIETNKDSLGTIITNISLAKANIQTIGLNKTNRGMTPDSERLRQKISNLRKELEKMDRFSSNINTKGIVGAIKEKGE